jgi:hypothetical protein
MVSFVSPKTNLNARTAGLPLWNPIDVTASSRKDVAWGARLVAYNIRSERHGLKLKALSQLSAPHAPGQWLQSVFNGRLLMWGLVCADHH